MIIESKTWMQRMKDRGYAGDPRQLHVKPPHFRVIKQAAADARKRRLKCWGKTQNLPMGEAAKQADDRLWSGKKRACTPKRAGTIMVQTSWGWNQRTKQSARRHAKSRSRNASGHFAEDQNKDQKKEKAQAAARKAQAAARKFKSLVQNLKKKDKALAAARKALGVEAKVVQSAQAGKWKFKR